MIIWQGKGILTMLVLLASLVLTISLVPEGQGVVAFSLAFFMGAAFSWHFGRKWNSQSRTVVDKESGEEIELKPNHSLFWIKMEYWGILQAIIGGLFLVMAFIDR